MCTHYGPMVNYFSKPDRDRANRHTEQGMPRMHWVIGVKGNGDQGEIFAQWTSGELQRLLKHLLDIVWKSFIRGVESGKRHLSVNLCWCIDFLKRLDGSKL